MTQLNSMEMMKGLKDRHQPGILDNLPEGPGLHMKEIGEVALATVIVATVVAPFINPNRADAAFPGSGTIGVENHCLDKDGNGTLETVHTIMEIANESIGNKELQYKITVETSPSAPLTAKAGDLLELFSGRNGTDGVVTPPYVADPHFGMTTYEQPAPIGPFTINSEVSGIGEFGFFRVPASDIFTCIQAVLPPPAPTPPLTPEVPPVVPPVIPPVVCAKPWTSVKTLPKVVKVNSKGFITVTSSATEAKIDGTGNGASKDAKLRNKASRLEFTVPAGVRMNINPKDKNILQVGGKVYKDVPASGVMPGKNLVDKFAFTSKTKGLKTFTAKLVVPANGDCLASNASATAKLKAK